MRKARLVQTLAVAAFTTMAACNGLLAVDDQSNPGPSAGYSNAGYTREGQASGAQASGGHAGALLPGPEQRTPANHPPSRASSVNGDNCPATLPDDESTCNVDEGQYCTYYYSLDANPDDVESQSCGCWLASGGTKRWDCGYANSAVACPDAEPGSGADCFGMRGVECFFAPAEQCDCEPTSPSADTMTWQCESTSPERGSPSGPAGVDATTPVAALTSAQRSAWCEWYSDAYNGAGTPDSTDRVDDNGYITLNGVAVGSRLECLACLPSVSKAGCAANLALSTCEAPVGALTDCALTIMDVCTPAPHGCAPYFDSPNCDGTMLVARPANVDPVGTSTCSIRVR